MQRKGLAQIPLILGLLVMAIAIPVATKLVQENQDSRNQAASCTYGNCAVEGATRCGNNTLYWCRNKCWMRLRNCPNGCDGATCKSAPLPTSVPGSCGTPGTVGQCGSKGGCRDGYKCMSSGTGMYGCVAFAGCIKPTNTPKPTAVPTKKPTATPAPCANTGQACSTRNCCRTTDVCTDEGFSYPRCVPRDQIPTYIPEPTPSCANTGQACSTRSCCHTTDVCTDEGFSYPRCVPRFPTSTPRPTARPTSRPTAVVTRVPTQSPSDKCPGAQACPDSTGRILRDCKKPDSDGTSRDIICNTVGQKDTCGGVEYCCPAIGGKWTTNMTQCPAGNCTQCSNDPGAKGKGDADCSRFTNLTDYSIWKEDYIAGDLGTSVKNTWRADFNCDGKVDLVNDYLIWKNYYIKTLQ